MIFKENVNAYAWCLASPAARPIKMLLSSKNSKKYTYLINEAFWLALSFVYFTGWWKEPSDWLIVDQSKKRKFAGKNEMGRPENKKIPSTNQYQISNFPRFFYLFWLKPRSPLSKREEQTVLFWSRSQCVRARNAERTPNAGRTQAQRTPNKLNQITFIRLATAGRVRRLQTVPGDRWIQALTN